MALIKTPEEIEQLKTSGKLLSECLELLEKEAVPDVSGKYLDSLAETFIRDSGAVPAFKNYTSVAGTPKFPNSICFSRNQVVVHGIPRENDILEEGDILTIDCGLSINGWFADAARLLSIGTIASEDAQIIFATKKALYAGIEKCREGNRLSDICHAIQTSVHLSKYQNVIQFAGHAIGRKMHEPPQVPNFGRPGKGPLLKAGMVFCLEPMLLKHRVDLCIAKDNWTIVTRDSSRATHIEHMVLIADGDPEILAA